MDLEVVKQAEWALSKCGRPVPPSGRGSLLQIPRAILLQANPLVTPAQGTATKEVNEAPFAIRSISGQLNTGLQVLLPNGRYLSNVPTLGLSGFGSYRYVFSRELLVPPGTRIQISYDFPFSALVEGADTYYLEGGHTYADLDRVTAAHEARYQADPNQNVMAPCYTWGQGPLTPDGYVDERFTYSSDIVTSDIGAAFIGTVSIPISKSEDFVCRRWLFQVVRDAGVTAGTFLGRIRAGSGYAFTDDFLDLALYLGGSVIGHDWQVAAGDRIFLDLALVDGAGVGNISFQAFVEGVKRRKR